MNRVVKLVNKKEAFGIVLGILAAIAILFTQGFYYDYLAEVNDHASIEFTDGQSGHVPVLKITHDAIPSVAEISINQALNFISDIVFSDEVAENDAPKTLRLDRYFENLFNLIISPNAP